MNDRGYFEDINSSFALPNTMMEAFGLQSDRGIELEFLSFTLKVSKEYKNQMHRPYVLNVTDSFIDGIGRCMDTVSVINNDTFSGLMANHFQPKTEAEGVIAVPCGWNEKRFVFVLRFAVPESAGFREIHTVSGYSTHSELYANNKLPPNMELVVDKVTVHKEVVRSDVHGLRSSFDLNLVDSINVMSNVAGNSAVRTTEIFQTPQALATYAIVSEIPHIDPTTMVIGNNVNSAAATQVDETTGLPANFLSKVVGQFKHDTQHMNSAAGLNSSSDVGTDENLFGKENMLTRAKNAFMHKKSLSARFLRKIASFRSTAANGYLTVAELNSVFPHFEDHPSSQLILGVESDLFGYNDVEDWGGRNNITILAATIKNIVPILMNRLGLAQCVIESSNAGINAFDAFGLGDNKLFVTSVKGFAIGDNQEREQTLMRCKALGDHFDKSVIDEFISPKGIYRYSLIVRSSVSGDTIIELDHEIYGKGRWCEPTWATSRTTPLLSTNLETLASNASALKVLSNEIEDMVTNIHIDNTFATAPSVLDNIGRAGAKYNF